MWAAVRLCIGIMLVLLIVVVVVSPYVDLPLTTVGAQQATLHLLAIISLCSAIAIGQHLRLVQHSWTHGRELRNHHDRRLLLLSCTLLC
jgi:hypothetical protein